jgi:hypothetical protein
MVGLCAAADARPQSVAARIALMVLNMLEPSR